MSKQDIKKPTPPLEQRVANIERTLESIAAQNQAVTPQKLDPKFEAEQQAHEAALESFNRDKLGRSLNSAATPEQVAEMLRKLDEKDKGKTDA